MKFYRFFRRAVRRAWSCAYRRHVGLTFSIAYLLANRPAGVPDGYGIRHERSEGDDALMAMLLSNEPGYGAWTAQRVREELLDHLAHPASASLVFHGDTPVGVVFATDASTARRRIAHGMYLYLAPAHRGRGNLARFMVLDVLCRCIDAGYDHIHGYTDPARLAAVKLHLSCGAEPRYDSLSSFWYWHRILRKLKAGRPAAKAHSPQV